MVPWCLLGVSCLFPRGRLSSSNDGGTVRAPQRTQKHPAHPAVPGEVQLRASTLLPNTFLLQAVTP